MCIAQDPRGQSNIALRRELGLLAWATRVGDSNAKLIHQALVSVMCDMALVDGDLPASKVQMVRDCHMFIFGEPVSEEIIEHMASNFSRLVKSERIKTLVEVTAPLPLFTPLLPQVEVMAPLGRVNRAAGGCSGGHCDPWGPSGCSSYADDHRPPARHLPLGFTVIAFSPPAASPHLVPLLSIADRRLHSTMG